MAAGKDADRPTQPRLTRRAVNAIALAAGHGLGTHRIRRPGKAPTALPNLGSPVGRSTPSRWPPDMVSAHTAFGGREKSRPPCGAHRYATSMAAIRPVSIWSITWQWNIHTPGLSATSA